MCRIEDDVLDVCSRVGPDIIRPPDSAFSSFNGYPLSVFYYYPSGYPTDSAFFVDVQLPSSFFAGS